MHGAHAFLTALTMVLCVAAVTTILFQRLRQPVVLGYILAGLIVGPHVPIPLVADRQTVQTLSELGVILLMFSLGLEFSLRKLVQLGPTAGLTAVIQSSIMVWLGFMVGRAFGWTTRECIFAGAIVAISSTTIIAKAFVGRALAIAAAVAVATPFGIGVFRLTRRLGMGLAQAALPPAAQGKADLGAAPRRALVVTLQLAVVLLVGLPFLALTQPFLSGWAAAIGLGALLVALGFVFWRSATNLQGHVKAGAEMIVEALVSQAGKPAAPADQEALDRIRHLMPGLGDPVPLRLGETSGAVGKTLAQLDLRGLTGAWVLAIARGEAGVIVPTASEVLHAGDVLAVVGTRDAVTAAKDLLGQAPARA